MINSIFSLVITITTRDIFQYLLPGVEQLPNKWHFPKPKRIEITDFSSLFDVKIGKIVHCADAAAIAIIDELGRK